MLLDWASFQGYGKVPKKGGDTQVLFQAFIKESPIAKTRVRMRRDYKIAGQRVWKRGGHLFGPLMQLIFHRVDELIHLFVNTGTRKWKQSTPKSSIFFPVGKKG